MGCCCFGPPDTICWDSGTSKWVCRRSFEGFCWLYSAVPWEPRLVLKDLGTSFVSALVINVVPDLCATVHLKSMAYHPRQTKSSNSLTDSLKLGSCSLFCYVCIQLFCWANNGLLPVSTTGTPPCHLTQYFPIYMMVPWLSILHNIFPTQELRIELPDFKPWSGNIAKKFDRLIFLWLHLIA